MELLEIANITPQNVMQETLFCIKDPKNEGFENKRKWFEKRYAEGLCLKILKNDSDKMIGFIEYTPADLAWRPVNAPNYMFIHCMVTYSKQDRNKGYGSQLIEDCEKDAKSRGMHGMCVMTSKGSWLADKRIFEKYGFEQVDKRGRFELLSKKWDDNTPDPTLIDWTLQQKKYDGWHLLYADQCPWHEKSVLALLKTAQDHDIDLHVKKITSAAEAKNAPSGFGVFSLLHNGKLIEDHYLSETRFRSILKKEMVG